MLYPLIFFVDDQITRPLSLCADVSYFFCSTREVKEIGDVCAQGIVPSVANFHEQPLKSSCKFRKQLHVACVCTTVSRSSKRLHLFLKS